MDTHSWLGVGTSTSMKRGKVKLVLWPQTSPLSEMIGSYKSFLRVRKHSDLHYNPTLWYRAFDDDDIVYSRAISSNFQHNFYFNYHGTIGFRYISRLYVGSVVIKNAES